MLSFLLRRYSSYLYVLGALSIALPVKFLLANASLNTLRFLLWMPAKLVALCFSTTSFWDNEKGYVFTELGIYINKGCAAINFLIILFLALFTLVSFYTSGKTRVKSLIVVTLLCYPICLLVNTLRILLSIQMQGLTSTISLSLRESLHEFTGGICFFGALICLLLITEKIVYKISFQNTSHS